MIPLALFFAATPADLAPGAQELAAAQTRYEEVYAEAEATGTATLQLQARWVVGKPPKSPCDDHDRLALGWRMERFGAAWREASQALRAQGTRLRELVVAPTVAPLLLGDSASKLEARLARGDAAVARFLQASAWEVAYVRPTLAACPLAGEGLDVGVTTQPVRAAGEGDRLVAVLASGSGVVCPGAIAADDAVIFVKQGEACWAPDAGCSCTPEPVFPGAVLGPPIVEGEVPSEPAPPASGPPEATK